MLEGYFAGGALLAGMLTGSSIVLATAAPHAPKFRLRREPRSVAAHAWLSSNMRKAGWSETPERVMALTGARGAALAALVLSSAAIIGMAFAPALAAGSFIAAIAWSGLTLRAAISARRAKLARELAPLLELFVLELGGGGSALSALGSVTLQLDCELAYELRRMLIAAQVAGSASLESRLADYAAEVGIPAIASLAAVIAAGREYGSSVAPGVRALAADLRQAQRRELITQSRRALNHVLFPAAVGVLLPFLCILLYPAVTTLHRSLQ